MKKGTKIIIAIVVVVLITGGIILYKMKQVHPMSEKFITDQIRYWQNRNTAKTGEPLPNKFVTFVQWTLDNPNASPERTKYVSEIKQDPNKMFRDAVNLGIVDKNGIVLI